MFRYVTIFASFFCLSVGFAAPFSFQSEDFPPSPYALIHTPRSNSENFLREMVVWTNQSLQDFGNESSPLSVLEKISMFRHEAYARDLDSDTQINPYGILRWVLEASHKEFSLQSYLGKSLTTFAGSSTSSRPIAEIYAAPQNPKEWAARALKLVSHAYHTGNAHYNESWNSILFENFERLSSGETVVLSRIELRFASEFHIFATPSVSLYSADQDASEKIYNDFLRRIENLNAQTDFNLPETADLMRNYFAAMFYSRGSAAIGRSFWNAFISHKLGRKILLHPEVDLFALTSTPDEFREL